MKANEYKAWYRRNDLESARRGLDEYNRPFGERYERPPEYSFGQEAYPQYPERLDISEKQEAYQKGEEKKTEKSKSSQSDAKKKQEKMRTRASQATRGAVQAVAAPVVGVVAGAAVLVAGYQAIESEASFEPLPIVTTVECDWDGDMMGATITLMDEEGNVIVASLPATVTAEETVAPTCTTPGTKTYTATVMYEETEYTKSLEETIDPLSHDFGEGVLTTNENGDPVYVYECNRCHEPIERSPFDVEEIDG